MFPWIPMIPILPVDYDIPPTLYSILNSIANFGVDEKTKIKDLALATHEEIFDFTYPLSTHVEKSDFEVLILNHFLMRRIGYETMTAFKIALNVKLNEIMPMYNKMFDMLDGWDLFNDGEVYTRTKSDSGTNSNTVTNNSGVNSTNTLDNRYADTPQGQLTAVQNGTYLSEYTYNTNTGATTSNSTSTSSGNDTNTTNETIERTPKDKMKIYKEFLENKTSIMTMIFKELDSLFYALV